MKKELYNKNWNLTAGRVKKKANYCCEHCGHFHDYSTNHVLTVHHINKNKKDDRFRNLVALCQRCHLKFENVSIPFQQWLFPDLIPDWIKKIGLV